MVVRGVGTKADFKRIFKTSFHLASHFTYFWNLVSSIPGIYDILNN